MCQSDAFPAIKWFSDTDESTVFPTPITCVRVDRQVSGSSSRTWADWFRLVRFVDGFPIP